MNSAIVLVIDRLGAGSLSPYGITWLDTPHCNRLASQSLLVEYATADSPQLDQAYRGFWGAQHAAGPGSAATLDPIRRLAEHGLHTALLTDHAPLVDHPLSAGFAEKIHPRSVPLLHAASEVEQTGIARLFVAALDWLEKNSSRPFLLWIHSRGMAGPWDAPSEMRQQFADDEDPVPPEFVEPPELELTDDYDPDTLLGFVHAYAGQVAVADLCLGVLLDYLEQNRMAERTALLLTSPRGYPLGEHKIVGGRGEALFSELLHVPFLLKMPGAPAVNHRAQAMLQPAHVASTLLDLWGLLEGEGQQWPPSALQLLGNVTFAPGFDRAVAVAESESAIRTPAWFLRRRQDDTTSLFVKPDDRWEANEVTNRCGEAVEELLATLAQFQSVARSGDLARLPGLPELLR